MFSMARTAGMALVPRTLSKVIFLGSDDKVRCDITFHPSWWYRHAGISFNESFFFDPAYRLKADQDMRRVLYEKFGLYGLGEKDPRPRPILWTDLLASGFLFSAMSGCEIIFCNHAPPTVQCALLSEDKIDQLSLDAAMNTRWWQEVLSQIMKFERQYGTVEPCVNLQGVQNVALDLRGQELFVDYYENSDLACRLISYVTDLLIATGKIFRRLSPQISAGVTAIVKKVMPNVYVHSNCTIEMISNDLYENFLLDADQRLSRDFQPYGIHHCGQSMEHVRAGYARILNLSFAEVGAGSDVGLIRQALGHKIHLNLRYSPVNLKDVSPERLKTQIAGLLAQSGSEDQTSVSCVGIDAEVPDSQIIAFLDLASQL